MSALEKYRELERELRVLRERIGDQDCPEEDAVLDAMDTAWWEMTDSERQQVDPTWGQLHYLMDAVRAEEEIDRYQIKVLEAVRKMDLAERRVWSNMGRGKWIRHRGGIVCPNCGYKILEFRGPSPPPRCSKCMTDTVPGEYA